MPRFNRLRGRIVGFIFVHFLFFYVRSNPFASGLLILFFLLTSLLVFCMIARLHTGEPYGALGNDLHKMVARALCTVKILQRWKKKKLLKKNI